MSPNLVCLKFYGQPCPTELESLLRDKIVIYDQTATANKKIEIQFRYDDYSFHTASILDIEQQDLFSPTLYSDQSTLYYNSQLPNISQQITALINLADSRYQQIHRSKMTRLNAAEKEREIQDNIKTLKDQEDKVKTTLSYYQREQSAAQQFLNLIANLERVETFPDLLSFITNWSRSILDCEIQLIYESPASPHLINTYFEDSLYTHGTTIAPICSAQKAFLAIEIKVTPLSDEMTNKLLSLQAVFSQKAKSLLTFLEIEKESEIWRLALDQLSIPILILDQNLTEVFKNTAFLQIQMPINFLGKSIKDQVMVTFKGADYIVEHHSVSIFQQDYHIYLLHNTQHERNRILISINNDKLNVIGRLSDKIAHELSNPIGGIKNLIEIIETSSHLPANHLEDLVQIKNGAERALRIIKALQDFANNKNLETQLYSPDLLIQEALMFSKSITRNMKILFTGHTETSRIKVQPDLFKQIIFNLIQNAAQACKNKGCIKIETKRMSSQLQISVTDDGPGISPEFQSQIFEPLFSTKKIGEGTGLGLAFVKNTLASWGGSISYDSTFHDGARFMIELPIFNASQSEGAPYHE